MAHGPIGVDLTSRPISIVQREAGGARPARVARTFGAGGLGSSVAGAIARSGMHGREVVLVVGNDSCHVAQLELPPRASGAPIARLAEQEVARLHRLEPGSFEMTTWDSPGPAASTSLLAVAMPHERSAMHLDDFESVGLDVSAIEPACAVMSELGPGRGASCVVTLAWRQASLVVTDGERPVIERSWAEGGCEALLARLKGELGLDGPAAEHVLRECLRGGASTIPEAVRGRAAVTIHDHFSKAADEIAVSLDYADRKMAPTRVGGVVLAGLGALHAEIEAIVTGAGIEPVTRWSTPEIEGSEAGVDALAWAAARRWG